MDTSLFTCEDEMSFSVRERRIRRLLSTLRRLQLIHEIKDGHHGMLFEIVPVRGTKSDV